MGPSSVGDWADMKHARQAKRLKMSALTAHTCTLFVAPDRVCYIAPTVFAQESLRLVMLVMPLSFCFCFCFCFYICSGSCFCICSGSCPVHRS